MDLPEKVDEKKEQQEELKRAEERKILKINKYKRIKQNIKI